MTRRVLLLLSVLLCLASCAVSKSSSTRFTYGDKSVSAYAPKKVALQLCRSDPSLRLEMIDVLSKNLADVGVEVMTSESLGDPAGICNGATLSEDMRKGLRDSLGIDGLFVGTLDQRRVEPLLLTSFELRLIDSLTGKLSWTTNVIADQLAALADVRATATKTTQLALEQFRKDFVPQPQETKKEPKGKSEKKRTW